MTVVYDPTGTLASNYISNEVHSPVPEPAIFTNQGSFYKDGFVITGVRVSDGMTVPLVEFVDYVFSPMFSVRSAETGKEVYTFVALNNYTAWSTITLTYHAVGGDPDQVLLSQIIAAGNFDRTLLENWLAFEGDIVELNSAGVDYDLKNTGVVYLFAKKLDEIALALRTPASYVKFILDNYNPLRSDVDALQAQIASWATSFTNNGVFSGTWASQNYVDIAIAALLSTVKGLIRTKLNADLTLYISPAGNDTNDGLTTGTPLATIQQAITLLRTKYDVNGYNAVIQLMDGVYATGVNIDGSDLNYITIQGNATTPTNTAITVTGQDCIHIDGGAKVTVKNCVLTSTVSGINGGNGISVHHGVCNLGVGMVFGACSVAHMVARWAAQIAISASYTIAGDAQYHVYIYKGDFGFADTAITVTLTGTRAFSGAFIEAIKSGANVRIKSSFVNFAGAATGVRYSADQLAVIETGGGATYLPGNVAGAVTNGAIYI